jgi:hypothetical protein
MPDCSICMRTTLNQPDIRDLQRLMLLTSIASIWTHGWHTQRRDFLKVNDIAPLPNANSLLTEAKSPMNSAYIRHSRPFFRHPIDPWISPSQPYNTPHIRHPSLGTYATQLASALHRFFMLHNSGHPISHATAFKFEATMSSLRRQTFSVTLVILCHPPAAIEPQYRSPAFVY